MTKAAAILAWFILAIPSLAQADLMAMLRPLPFPGPYHGQVADADTGLPLANATIKIKWTRHDTPLPDGPRHRAITESARTDLQGSFNVPKLETRGGLFSTRVAISISAAGYITRVLVIDPNNAPLPQQTVDWPFRDTSVHISPPEPLDVKLKPALPVILKALQSKEPFVRKIAEEELLRLKKNIQPSL